MFTTHHIWCRISQPCTVTGMVYGNAFRSPSMTTGRIEGPACDTTLKNHAMGTFPQQMCYFEMPIFIYRPPGIQHPQTKPWFSREFPHKWDGITYQPGGWITSQFFANCSFVLWLFFSSTSVWTWTALSSAASQMLRLLADSCHV